MNALWSLGWFLVLGCVAWGEPGSPFLLRVLHGAEAGDRFGAALERVFDLDGDGVDDLLIGAPEAKVDGVRRGMVRVVSGRTGATIREHFGGLEGDEFGAAVAQAAIDLDGDGVVDYGVGAPGGGYLRVLSGKKGKTLYEFHSGLPAEARFGAALCAMVSPLAGLFGDFAVGAPLDDAFGVDAGSVFAIRSGAIVSVIPGFAEGERFGASLSFHELSETVPVDRILIGAPGAANHGRTYLYSLQTMSVEETLAGPTTGTPAGFGEDAGTFRFCSTQGVSVCSFVSVIGAPGTNGGQGSARVFAGDLSDPPTTLLGPAADASFGSAAALPRSPTMIRVAIGAPGSNGGDGAVHVYDAPDFEESFRIEGASSGRLGTAVAAGAFDLDEGDELAVGAPDEGAGTVRIHRLAPVKAGPAFVVGDLVAASLEPQPGVDVDVGTFEATKGTKLKLRVQTAGVEWTEGVPLDVRLKDPKGKTRKSWTIHAAAKPVTKKTKLKASGGWTLELEAAGGAGGTVVVATSKQEEPEVYVHVDQKKAKAVKVAFDAIAGTSLDFEVDPDDAPPPVTIVLTQPDGTDHPDLASHQSGLEFADVPLGQTGRYTIVVKPAAPGTLEISGWLDVPPSGAVVEID